MGPITQISPQGHLIASLDLSTASGGFYGFTETGRSWYETAIRSQRVKDAQERNARARRVRRGIRDRDVEEPAGPQRRAV